MKVFNKQSSNATLEKHTNRDNSLDIVAGILIVRMIFGHYMSMSNLKETMLFESLNTLFFYMPWFFFKSGMFCSSSRKETFAYLRSNLKKFAIPFVFFSVIGTIIASCSSLITNKNEIQVIMGEVHSFIIHGSTNWNGALWFLISLCFVRVAFNYLRKYINEYALISISFILACIHYEFVSNHGIYWGGNICSGLFFYICGKKLKEIQYNKYIVAIALVMLVLIGILSPTIVTMFGNFKMYDWGNYALWYPFCLAGIIVFNNFIKYIGKCLVHYNFGKVGQNSMVYYVIHYPLGFAVCDIYNKFNPEPNNWELLTYLCIMWLLILPLLTYMFNTKSMTKFIGK